jgi:isopentenyl-diphosphate delta-isomerase
MADDSVRDIEQRKSDHIRINVEQDVRGKGITTGFEAYRFLHQALPEIDFGGVTTTCHVLGHSLGAPILISSMTGGVPRAAEINRTLAAAAQHFGLAMGVGSQRLALEQAQFEQYYRVRDAAPDILLFANIGAVQLNYGYGVEDCLRAVRMVEADALFLHLNPLQEAVQVGGNVNFGGLAARIHEVCHALPIPVVVKEVGWGISAEVAQLLVEAGVSAIDVAGAGGTSWSEVERHRGGSAHLQRVAGSFASWGISTVESLLAVRRAAPNLTVFASGGLRTGIDVAKAIALGASLAGLASPALRAAVQSETALHEELAAIIAELRTTMFCLGASTIGELSRTPHLVLAPA